MSGAKVKFSGKLQGTGVKYQSMDNTMSTGSNTERTPMSAFEKYTQFVRENIKMKTSIDETSATTCFGNIHFKETKKKSTARFIRGADDTDPEKLITLFTEHWNLEKPRLLISVTGGAKSFDLSPQLKKDFHDGLLKVANTPGTWVISGGTNTGVMKLVGDANHGAENICIGIATWGIIAERDSLKPTKQHRSGETFPYRLGSYLIQKGEAFLDYNHTHFILVDNGTDGQWGKEIAFRGKFEDHVTQTSNPRVPSVLLVLEGGPGTLDTVLKAVKNSIPCVVVEGSGRAADVLVYAINYKDQIREVTAKGEPHKGLIEAINSAFSAQIERDKVLPLVLKCIQKKNMDTDTDTDIYTIVKVSEGVDTDEAILTALLKDKKTSPSHYEQMRLALLWDRVDLAETKIMSKRKKGWIPRPQEGNIAETRSTEELAAAAQQELNELMIMALAMNKVGFIKMFLSYGVSIKSLLTKNVLQFLYAYRRNMGLSTLRYKVTPRPMKNDDIKHRDLFETLQQYHTKRRSKKISAVVQEILLEDIREILLELLSSIPDRFLQQVIEIPRDCDETFDTPFRQLFIWAVMNNMLDLAMMLWEFEDDPICKALFAAEITNGLINSIRNLDLQDEVEMSLQLSFSTYQKLSLDLLDLCYKTNEKNTESLITTHIGLLSNLCSCLDFAVASKQMDFVAHSSVQGILNDVWTGSIAQRYISGFKICAYVFLPFLLRSGTPNWEIEIRTQNEMKEMIQTSHFDDSDEEAEEQVVNHRKKSAGNIVSDAKARKKSLYLASNENTGLPDTMEEEESRSQLRTRLSLWQKFYNFHVFSPIVRFYTHTFGYLLFLMLFSYIATVKKTSSVPTRLEGLLIITVIGYAANEIYQLFHIDAPSFGLKIKGYAQDFWNQFDIVCLYVFVIAIILRCIPSTVEYGHLFYAFDVSLWIVRLINILYVDPAAGPYVVMIGHMFWDLVNFLIILVIFLLAYGIAVKGILDPTEADAQMFVASVFKPYFHWHGEYFFGEHDENTTYFGTEKRNSYAEPIAFIYMALYLLIVNILLLNLVIAIFNSTYEKIMAIALRVWRFQRYGLIVEYAQRRSFLFPPFSLMYHFYIMVRWCLSKCTRVEAKSCCSGLKPHGNPNCPRWQAKREKFREMENKCLIRLVRERENSEAGLDVPVESSGSLEKLEARIIGRLENMADKFENMANKFEKERRELQDELEQREKELGELKTLVRKEKTALQDES